MGCAQWLLPATAGEGIKEELHSQNLANTTSARWSRSTSLVKSHLDNINLWQDAMRGALHLGAFLPQTHKPSLVMRETSDKPQSRDVLQNTWLHSFKLSRAPKTRKRGERVSAKSGLRRHVYMWCDILDRILEQKEDIRLKLRKSE